MDQTIKLTNKCIEQLRIECSQGTTKRDNFTLQYLGTQQAAGGGNQLAILSDGYIKDKFALYKNIKSEIAERPPKVGAVLEAEVIFHKGQLLILTGYTKTHNEELPTIGDPIWWEDYDAGTPYSNNATSQYTPVGGARKTGGNRTGGGAIQSSSDMNVQLSFQKRVYNTLSEEDFTPIKLLSQSTTSWIIRARLESIGTIRTFNKKNGGQGKVCNCIFMDNSSKIQMTFWSEDVDKHVVKFVEGKVYAISNADVKRGGQYNRTEHQCELTCSRTTQITDCEDSGNIKTYAMNLNNLGELATEKTGGVKTVYCVIYSIPEVETITRKDGSELKKVGFKIVDSAQIVVDVIAWGDQNMQVLSTLNKFDTVIITNLYIKEFRNVKHFSFSTPGCKIHKNPDVPKELANDMLKFRNDLKNGVITDIKISSPSDSTGGNSVIYQLESIISDANRRILEEGEERIYYNTFAYLTGMAMKRNLTWRRSESDEPIFLASAKVSDHTMSTWVTLAGGGEAILGMTPTEAYELQEASREAMNAEENVPIDNEMRDKINSRKGIGYWMKIRAQRSDYNGNVSLRLTVMQAWSCPSESDKNCHKMNKNLLNTLKTMMGKVAA